MASRKEVAEHLFMSVQNVGILIQNGVLYAKPGPNPLDLEACRRNYIEYLQKQARFHLKDGTGDINQEKTKLVAAQATKAQLDVAVIEGKLIPTDLVEQTWINYIANCRGKLLTIPNKITHLVLASEDFAEIEQTIKDAIYETLEELANDPIPKEYRENTAIDETDMEPAS